MTGLSNKLAKKYTKRETMLSFTHNWETRKI